MMKMLHGKSGLVFVLAIVIAGCGSTASSNTTEEKSCGSDSVVDGIVESRPDTLTIAMVGDILMGTDYPSRRLPKNDGAELFQDAMPVFCKADVVAGNLEGILSVYKKCRKDITKPYCYAFRTPPEYVKNLVAAHFTYVNLANNHIFDFFQTGVDDTKAVLDSAGIKYSGLLDSEFAVCEKNGIRYGFCSFGHSKGTLYTYEDETVSRVIKNLRSKCDILIVCFHGGSEGSDKGHIPYTTEYFCGENRGNLRKFTHLCIDNGADVVFGSGPHVTRGVELYNGRFIAYSLGNFCAPYGLGTVGLLGYAPIIEIQVDNGGKYLGGTIHSLVQVPGVGPRRDSSCKVSHHIMDLTKSDIPSENVPEIVLN